MLAEKSETIKEAAATVKKLNADEKIKLQCEAREKYERDMLSAIHTGEKRGEKRGKKEGRQEGRIMQLIDLVKEGILDESVAQQKSGLSEAEFKKYFSQKD